MALAERAFSGEFGMTIELTNVRVENIKRTDTILFSESQKICGYSGARQCQEVEEIMKGNVFADVGEVTSRQDFSVMDGEKVVLSAGIDELKEAWQKTLRW